MSKLLSEQNNKKVDQKIQGLAKERFPNSEIYTVYEHGHWWLKVVEDDGVSGKEMLYDVVDIENGEDDLDFELIDETEF